MTEQTSRLPSLELIAKYVSALSAGDTSTMQSSRSTDFVPDWVHGDAFKNRPLTQAETSQLLAGMVCSFFRMGL